MKLIHTADWHLGQSFHGQERHAEHRAFLDWLLDTLVERRADALLVAGDLFDVVNPSLRAQELLYDFIVSAHQRLPRLDIVLIAGNHDSGNRIELPAPLMKRLRTHALGRVNWLDDGRLDAERLLVPLTDSDGETRAWCLALPFLRPAEVTGTGPGDAADDGDCRNDYVAGIERVHRQLIDAARDKRQPGQALVAMSHAHLHGAAVSEASERPIVIGGEESISASLFPAEIAYVALGHLHRAQQVGEARIRYSGSPCRWTSARSTTRTRWSRPPSTATAWRPARRFAYRVRWPCCASAPPPSTRYSPSSRPWRMTPHWPGSAGPGWKYGSSSRRRFPTCAPRWMPPWKTKLCACCVWSGVYRGSPSRPTRRGSTSRAWGRVSSSSAPGKRAGASPPARR